MTAARTKTAEGHWQALKKCLNHPTSFVRAAPEACRQAPRTATGTGCALAALFAALLAASCTPLDQPGPADTVVTSGTLQITKALTNWKDIRDRNVVMQRFDYSCGAAALATLMHYYFGDDVSEVDVLNDMLHHLEPGQLEKVQREGFSLLDLKNFAERRGYLAVGVRFPLTALPQLRGPVLIYLELTDTKHFAILRGVREDRVYLADPSRGNLRMRIDRFADEWPSGIALVLGQLGFGTPQDTLLAVDQQNPYRIEIQSAREALFGNSGLRSINPLP